jgi:hypothetical protein
MARLKSTDAYGCPLAAETSPLAKLLLQREKLMTQITSGVMELDQPVLGRAQYRPMDEMLEALRILDGLIAGAGGAGVTATAKRCPIYPVVREY